MGQAKSSWVPIISLFSPTQLLIDTMSSPASQRTGGGLRLFRQKQLGGNSPSVGKLVLDFGSNRACEGRLLSSEQPPLPYHRISDDHVDDRRLAASVGFEAAVQRILELFRIGHLLAVTGNAFAPNCGIGPAQLLDVMKEDRIKGSLEDLDVPGIPEIWKSSYRSRADE